MCSSEGDLAEGVEGPHFQLGPFLTVTRERRLGDKAKGWLWTDVGGVSLAGPELRQRLNASAPGEPGPPVTRTSTSQLRAALSLCCWIAFRYKLVWLCPDCIGWDSILD